MYAEKKENEIIIYDSYIHKDTIKEIQGRRWNPNDKTWSIPYTLDILTTLQMIGCNLSDELKEVLKNKEQNNSNKEIPNEPIEPMPISVKPYSHQIKGFNLACYSLGIFNRGDVA